MINFADLPEQYPIIYEQQPLVGTDEMFFDQLLSEGWRFLGSTALCHSVSVHYEQLVLTIPGRIVLDRFVMAESQKKCLRRGLRALRVELEEKQIKPIDEALFTKHASRFDDNPPTRLPNMVCRYPTVPVQGMTYRIYLGDRHVATSFFHLGQTAIDGSYCVYDPDPALKQFSLGNFTLLLEIQYALEHGYTYYYLGYRYNKPSHFDYKANFYGMERLSFPTMDWVYAPRLEPRKLEVNK